MFSIRHINLNTYIFHKFHGAKITKNFPTDKNILAFYAIIFIIPVKFLNGAIWRLIPDSFAREYILIMSKEISNFAAQICNIAAHPACQDEMQERNLT